MPLSPGERIDLKKRLIARLYEETWADTRLIFDEFGFPTPTLNYDNQASYIRGRLNDVSDVSLIQLDRYFYPDESREQEPPMSALMEGQENTPFSPDERSRIANVVAEVLEQAQAAYGLPEEDLRLLEAKLEYLVEAAQHSRRIDWLNTAVGAVAGAFAGGVLTPDVVNKVLTALGAGLGPLFGHPVPLLGP